MTVILTIQYDMYNIWFFQAQKVVPAKNMNQKMALSDKNYIFLFFPILDIINYSR